jgi:hypothetical protein
MTNITHDAARDALTMGEPIPEDVRHHAASCASCKTYATAVDHLARDAAAHLAPGTPPAGLEDRVVSAVSAKPTPRSIQTAFFRPNRLVLVAAVTLVVAGIVAATLATPNNSEQLVLISAARHLEEDGPVDVSVESTTTVDADRQPGAAPDYSTVPTEMRGYFEVEFDRMMAAFETQVGATLDDANRTIDEAMKQMEGALGGRATRPSQPTPSQPTPSQPPPPQPGAPKPPEPPTRLTLGVRITATGTVAPGHGGTLEGTVTPVDGTLRAPTGSAEFGVAVQGDVRAVRGPEGTWARVDPSTGPLASFLLRPDAAVSLLRGAEEVKAAGDVEVDGRTYRRYRFRAAAAWDVEVLIDRSDRLRRIDVRASGEGGSGSDSHVTVDVTGRNSTAVLGLPNAVASGEVQAAPTGPSAAIYPVGASVEAALQGDRR